MRCLSYPISWTLYSLRISCKAWPALRLLQLRDYLHCGQVPEAFGKLCCWVYRHLNIRPVFLTGSVADVGTILRDIYGYGEKLASLSVADVYYFELRVAGICATTICVTLGQDGSIRYGPNLFGDTDGVFGTWWYPGYVLQFELYATFIFVSTAFRNITEKMSFLATYLQCLVLGLVIIANSQVLFNLCL